MIRIEKDDSPDCLLNDGPALVAADYARYDLITDKASPTKAERESFSLDPLYKRASVKAALVLAQAGEKCAYCEKSLVDEPKHVDHFRPYGAVEAEGQRVYPGYFWLGYTWSNLYLSCHSCNSTAKIDQFPLSNPATRVRPPDDDITVEDALLVDPGVEDPRDHIRFNRDAPYAFNASPKGKRTIDVLKLGKRPGLVSKRQEWFGELERLREVVEIFRDYPNYSNLETSARKALAKLCQAVGRRATFSSMAKDFLEEFLEDFQCG
jgi:uncharacterized protein (TIGR02646 family)